MKNIGIFAWGFFLGWLLALALVCKQKPEPKQVMVFVCPKCGFHFLVNEWYIEMPPTNIFDSARTNDPQDWKEAFDE